MKGSNVQAKRLKKSLRYLRENNLHVLQNPVQRKPARPSVLTRFLMQRMEAHQ